MTSSAPLAELGYFDEVDRLTDMAVVRGAGVHVDGP